MYKRDTFVFASNLKSITCDPLNPDTLKGEAYLLSAEYASKQHVEMALFARGRKNLIISDNGNFSNMSAIAKKFKPACDKFIDKAYQEKKNGKLSQTTLAERKKLIEEITKVCAEKLEKQNKSALIKKQMTIRPHSTIGLEDFTIPALMMSGLYEPMFSPDPREINPFQKITRDLYKKESQGDFGEMDALSQTRLFLVLHAYDYASAYQGGKHLRGKKHINGVAISYGAPMASNRWVSGMYFGKKYEEFHTVLPEKYLAAQSITLGALNGMKSSTPLHLLGVGSPILLALIGGLTSKSSAVSIDATSPFKDADDGNIYGSREALIKMDMYKVAAYHLLNETVYTSTTPFWKTFNKKHPSDWKGLHKKLQVKSQMIVSDLAKKLKQSPKLLEQYIPFFSKMRSGGDALIKDVRLYRAGHNYWILRNICKNIRDRKANPKELQAWVEKEIERYTRIASPQWAFAVQKTYELTQKYRDF